MLKISGLEKLQRQLEDAQRAFGALDGEIATVRFDPNSPDSVQAAIRSMEAAVDHKISPYRGNALVESVVPKLKEKYRAAILERAKRQASG
ncbi:MAG TPA: hypothetical protein VMH84_09080 [Xanthobacteraceae bacterium]|nr:hypothetical protein [Xanthobacteraceae bacterium]